jgi:hypothetical protein
MAQCSVLPLATGANGALYRDGFDDSQSQWVLEADLEASARIADGQLLLNVLEPNLVTWAQLTDRTFGDFVLEVEATQVSGPNNNSYGVLFRVQDPTAYYRFDISGDGYYAVTRRDPTGGGRWTWLTGDWVPSTAIHQGASTNRIRVLAQGSHFVFWVNGEQLTEADDKTYSRGAIGLNAGSFDEPGVMVSFDNLTITKP